MERKRKKKRKRPDTTHIHTYRTQYAALIDFYVELADTFVSSSFRLMTKQFGRVSRRVPAHMPHMLQRSVIEDMQSV